MTQLAQQQQALLAALFDPGQSDATITIAVSPGAFWARGINVYQANGHALALRALRAAYPVVAQLLGDESFEHLAQALWHHSPPRCGDAGRWGDTLEAFVRADAQLANVPYLADVAHVEWLLHISASAINGWADPASFSLLAQHDPADLQLRLAPGYALYRSAWPVVSIIQAHLQDSTPLEHVGALVRAGVGEEALVWRAGLHPQVRLAQAGEAAFLSALQCEPTLGAALAQSLELDVTRWLPMAVQTGLLLGVRLAPGLMRSAPNEFVHFPPWFNKGVLP